MVLNRGQPWSTTWSSTVIHVVLNRTTHGPQLDFRGHLLDYRGPLRGHQLDFRSHLPDYCGPLRGQLLDYAWSSTWSSTRLPWSSTWSFARLCVVIYRNAVVLYVVLCQTSMVLCMVIWRLHGHQLDCICPTYLELPSVTETFEIVDQCEL